MNPDWLHGSDDTARDPELAAALDALDPVPALGEPEWERLRAAVRARAERPLARRRRAAHPRTAAGRRPRRWAGGLVGAAAAAAVVAVFALRGTPAADPLAGAPEVEAASMHAVVQEVLGVPVSRAEYELLFATDADTDALLVAVATP